MERDSDKVLKYDCPVVYSVGIIGRKWTLPILCELNKNEVMRYGELKKALSGVTNMALAQLLKELVNHDIVQRIQYNEVPLRVEYSLTSEGKKLLPSLYSIAHWGLAQMKKEHISCTCDDKCYGTYFEYIPSEKVIELKGYPEKCDKLYYSSFARIEAEKPDKPVADKLEAFMLDVLRILTGDGGEYARWALTFSFRNDTPDLFRKERAYYQIVHRLIEEGREKGLINSNMTTEQIIGMTSKIITGCTGDWEIANCTYDIIEHNKDLIHWLCESLLRREEELSENREKK